MRCRYDLPFTFLVLFILGVFVAPKQDLVILAVSLLWEKNVDVAFMVGFQRALEHARVKPE